MEDSYLNSNRSCDVQLKLAGDSVLAATIRVGDVVDLSGGSMLCGYPKR